MYELVLDEYIVIFDCIEIFTFGKRSMYELVLDEYIVIIDCLEISVRKAEHV